ncbi:MAG TPA: sugar ABC transporter permease, partial [Thermoanaerobaculia bacterium]|nr:sugar ABC transporter permease [Thermoanaerobaculia bacterium]
MRRLSSWRAREARAGLLLVAPGLLLLALFLALPVVAALLLSLTDFDLYAIGDPSTARFVGLGNRLVRFPGLFRTVYFAPVVTTLVAVAAVWRYLYHPRFGLLNAALGLIGIGPVDWLGDPRWAMPAIVLMAAWKNFGANMIIFVAGLKAI